MGPTPTTTVAESYALCERVCRERAANFYPAFLLLPRPQRLAMCALYAFMRITDDLADEPGDPVRKRLDLARWRRGLDDALAGRPGHETHPALYATVVRYRVSPAYLHAVIDGVEADLEPVRYATFAELYPYCWRVASAVGLACIHIWGFRDIGARAPAEAAGIAFQLTNILRDLAEDRSNGRVYLPTEDLERFGCADPAAWSPADPAFRAMMRFQVARARDYYRAAEPLTGQLRPAGRAVFGLMRDTYRGLLEEIEARGYDVFSRRVRLGRWRKLALFARACPVRCGWG
jgi:phytoene synthase